MNCVVMSYVFNICLNRFYVLLIRVVHFGIFALAIFLLSIFTDVYSAGMKHIMVFQAIWAAHSKVVCIQTNTTSL